MKMEYEKPVIEVIAFDVTDQITGNFDAGQTPSGEGDIIDWG